MVVQKTFTLPAHPKGFHLITSSVLEAIGKLPDTGVLSLFIKHTSAGLAVNENADPTVRQDLSDSFDRIAPEGDFYAHDDEGSEDMPAHIKSVLAGSSITLPISSGRLNLGTWQGIYLCEFRAQATPRTLVASILS